MINFINREIIIKNIVKAILDIENIYPNSKLEKFLYEELIENDEVEIWNSNHEYAPFTQRLNISIFYCGNSSYSLNILVKYWSNASYSNFKNFEFKIFANNKVKPIMKKNFKNFAFFKNHNSFFSQTSKKSLTF